MKRILKLFVLVSFVFVLTGCGKTYLKEISYSEYEKLIENKETFILEVMRDDCSACVDYKPKITEVANKYKIEIKYINTNNLSEEENNKLAEKIAITGTPTTIFYNDGVEKTKSSRIGGSASVEKIITKFKANGFIKEDK